MAIPAATLAMAEECDVVTTWRWIVVDFTTGAREAPDCQCDAARLIA
jgi:hypothetical protein